MIDLARRASDKRAVGVGGYGRLGELTDDGNYFTNREEKSREET